jgi:hypothetical protein
MLNRIRIVAQIGPKRRDVLVIARKLEAVEDMVVLRPARLWR